MSKNLFKKYLCVFWYLLDSIQFKNTVEYSFNQARCLWLGLQKMLRMVQPRDWWPQVAVIDGLILS